MGEENAGKGISIGAGLLILLGVLGVIFVLYRIGIGWATKSTGQIGTTMSQFDDSTKQIYDGMTISGSEVISVINTFYPDEDMQVLVCTRDGANYVYTTMKDTMRYTSANVTSTIDESRVLVGYPACDAVGKPFLESSTAATGSATNTAVIKVVGDKSSNGDYATSVLPSGSNITIKSGELITKVGYNDGVSPEIFGAIQEGSNFKGSTQKDSNGVIRQITFVQQ